MKEVFLFPSTSLYISVKFFTCIPIDLKISTSERAFSLKAPTVVEPFISAKALDAPCNDKYSNSRAV
jgi:hypothetical protein